MEPTRMLPGNSLSPQKLPLFLQPKIVGAFSLDKDRKYVPNRSNCKFVHNACLDQKRHHFDLNEGLHRVVRKPVGLTERIDNMLRFIMRTSLSLQGDLPATNPKQPVPADIVCFRGLLRLLMVTPYEHHDGLIILATKFRGTVYLCRQPTAEEISLEAERPPYMQTILSYGFKFEQYVLTDDPAKKPDTRAPVNENEEFCCVFTTTMNNKRLMYGAEMDGIESREAFDLETADLNEHKLAELKVSIMAREEKQLDRLHRFKYRNWWCQCYLTKVRKVTVGTRNKRGIVTEVSQVSMGEMARLGKPYWSPAVCVHFLDVFLTFVTKAMKNVDCPHTVYRFDYQPPEHREIQMQRFVGPNEFSFVPPWFITAMEARVAAPDEGIPSNLADIQPMAASSSTAGK